MSSSIFNTNTNNTTTPPTTPPPTMMTPPNTPKATFAWASLIEAGNRYIDKVMRYENNILARPVFDIDEDGLAYNLSDLKYKPLPVSIKKPSATEHNTQMLCKACNEKVLLSKWKVHKNETQHTKALAELRVNVTNYNKRIEGLATPQVLRETGKLMYFDHEGNVEEYKRVGGYIISFAHDFDAELSGKAARLHKLIACHGSAVVDFDKTSNRYTIQNRSGIREGIVTDNNKNIYIPSFWIDGKMCSATVACSNPTELLAGMLVECELLYKSNGELVAKFVREVNKTGHLLAPLATEHFRNPTDTGKCTPTRDSLIPALVQEATLSDDNICIEFSKAGWCSCTDKSKSKHIFVEDLCGSSKFTSGGTDINGTSFTLKSSTTNSINKTEFHIIREKRALCYSINGIKRSHFRHFEYDGESILISSIGKKVTLPKHHSLLLSDLRVMAKSMGVTHNLDSFTELKEVQAPSQRFLKVSCPNTLSRIQDRCGGRTVKAAWEVINNSLELQFQASVHNMKKVRKGIKHQKIVQGFHGTPEQNLMGIAKTGFDPSKRSGQAYGAGEYFGKTTDVSSSYMAGGGFMYLCDLFLGGPEDHHIPPGVDMIIVKQHNGWVQSVPRYLLDLGSSYYCGWGSSTTSFREQLTDAVDGLPDTNTSIKSIPNDITIPVVNTSINDTVLKVLVKGLHPDIKSNSLALGDMTEFFGKNFNVSPTSAILRENDCVVTFDSPICQLIVLAANRTLYRGLFRLHVAAC
eukprot:TRINITY_DN7184_c0_g1_i1.p1 TRINITY_DN7184_c0_g1~~TRINITY_DN7184_c0_g1_i1.p1  ORF type:complete len:771 (+),score=174.77 TRINITY_DN7184_c0_g1_i1:68-2314(+)